MEGSRTETIMSMAPAGEGVPEGEGRSVVAVERAAVDPGAMESVAAGGPESVVIGNLRCGVHAVSIAKVQMRRSVPGRDSAIPSRLSPRP
jgi:hypothetical protein